MNPDVRVVLHWALPYVVATVWGKLQQNRHNGIDCKSSGIPTATKPVLELKLNSDMTQQKKQRNNSRNKLLSYWENLKEFACICVYVIISDTAILNGSFQAILRRGDF
jgi:hypothetical protein